MLLHERREALLVHREAAVSRELRRQLDREAVGRGQRKGVVGRDVALRRDLLEQPHPARERFGEALLLTPEDVPNAVPVLRQLRIPRRHLFDDDVREPPEVFEADLARLLHGAADDPAQHVAATFVRGGDAVADEERHPAAVVGEHPMRFRRGLVSVPGDTALCLDPCHDRLVAVRLVDRADTLHDRGQPLEPQAGIDVLRWEGRQRPVRVQLVLHEDEVPELEESVAPWAGGRAAGVAAAVLLTPVVVDLGIRPARTRPADRPEVLRARQLHDPLARHPDRLPQRDRGGVLTEPERRVAGVHSGPDPLPLELEVFADELGGELDRAFLEVLPE